VILLLWFSINPDDRIRWSVVPRQSRLAFRGQQHARAVAEYIGHDNNRDGYMNNMIESQVITAPSSNTSQRLL